MTKSDRIIRIQYSVTILVLRFCYTLSVIELQCVRYTVLSRERCDSKTYYKLSMKCLLDFQVWLKNLVEDEICSALTLYSSTLHMKEY